MAGNTSGTFPGQTWAGSGDFFVRQYDADGNELLTYQLGSRGSDGITSIVVDQKGNAWVAGFTEGTLPRQRSAGKQDAFVLKYSR